jgi:transcriptional accessory protein Tex/SPT6
MSSTTIQEKVSSMPSHRFLAIRRGTEEKVLRFHLACEAAPLLRRIGEIIQRE